MSVAVVHSQFSSRMPGWQVGWVLPIRQWCVCGDYWEESPRCWRVCSLRKNWFVKMDIFFFFLAFHMWCVVHVFISPVQFTSACGLSWVLSDVLILLNCHAQAIGPAVNQVDVPANAESERAHQAPRAQSIAPPRIVTRTTSLRRSNAPKP